MFGSIDRLPPAGAFVAKLTLITTILLMLVDIVALGLFWAQSDRASLWTAVSQLQIMIFGVIVASVVSRKMGLPPSILPFMFFSVATIAWSVELVLQFTQVRSIWVELAVLFFIYLIPTQIIIRRLLQILSDKARNPTSAQSG